MSALLQSGGESMANNAVHLNNQQSTLTPGSLIWLGILFAAVFYLLDVLVDVYVFDHGELRDILLHPSGHELWMRFAVMFIAMLTAFGVYMNEMTLRHDSSLLAGWIHGVFNSQKLGIWVLLFPGVNPILGGYAGVCGLIVWSGLAWFALRTRRVRPIR